MSALVRVFFALLGYFLLLNSVAKSEENLEKVEDVSEGLASPVLSFLEEVTALVC